MDTIEAIFGTGQSITWVQECARAMLIFAYGIAAVRLAGRRIFGKWSAIDIVVSIIVGSNLSRALTGNAPLFGTLAATTLLMLLHWMLAHASARWSIFSRIFEGEAVMLGQGGAASQHTMRAHGVTQTDLAEALRSAGLVDPAASRLLMLEPSGKISVLRA